MRPRAVCLVWQRQGLDPASQKIRRQARRSTTGKLAAQLRLDSPQVQGYTFNVLQSRTELPKIRSFQDWLFGELEERRIRA